jgi:hypothetical protein
VTVVLAGIGMLAVVQSAGAAYIRPKAASPLRVSLVPAFDRCIPPPNGANRTHGPPLGYPSCYPPAASSDFLTVGTPDANGAPANSTGFIEVKVKVTSPEDVLIRASVSDVRCKPGTAANVCGSANAVGGADYTGELQGDATLRLTDHYNGPNHDEAATVVDIPFPISMPCTSTADTSIGATCGVVTCSSCIGPPYNWFDGQRIVTEISQFEVFDGGPDGSVATNDNTVFLRQGLFVP